MNFVTELLHDLEAARLRDTLAGLGFQFVAHHPLPILGSN